MTFHQTHISLLEFPPSHLEANHIARYTVYQHNYLSILNPNHDWKIIIYFWVGLGFFFFTLKDLYLKLMSKFWGLLGNPSCLQFMFCFSFSALVFLYKIYHWELTRKSFLVLWGLGFFGWFFLGWGEGVGVEDLKSHVRKMKWPSIVPKGKTGNRS